MSSAISTSGLTRRFGSLVAVDSVSLEVPAGSIYGLIGQNGAGKTTTIAMLAALLRPSEGSIDICGVDPMRKPREAARRLGFMPDMLGFYDRLNVVEYLDFYGSAYRIPARRRATVIAGLLELVELTPQRDAVVDSLSRGMKQRLSLARALIHEPDVLLLDEPASGLDPRARVELRELLRGLSSMGKTIVVSSHILAELEEMCTDVAIMHKGRVVAAGPMTDVIDRGSRRRLRVLLADGTEQVHEVADAEEQLLLLRRLVGEGLDIMEFRQEHDGLQELYLSVTEE